MLDQQTFVPRMGKVWRIVETQVVAATRNITRSAEEQHRLEALLDQSKPPVADDLKGLSYLLMTPFRYPPLKHGSRFGSTWERGIFYASQEHSTLLAEAAVYLWLFQAGLKNLGPLEHIRDSRTAFLIGVSSEKTLDLRLAPFDSKEAVITAPSSWDYTQSLGSQLREMGAEFFWYPSARFKGGTNVAVMSPKCFTTKKPEKQQHWMVHLTQRVCWFGRRDGESMEFLRSDFEYEGKLQHPSLTY